MNCTEFRQALEKHIEDRRPLSADAQAHEATCSSGDCQKVAVEAQWLQAAVDCWTADVPRVDLADAILLQLSPAVTARPESIHPPAAPAGRTWQLVVALTVLVAASAVLWTPRDTQWAGSPPKITPPVQIASLSSDSQAREISRRYVAWAEGTGSLVTDAVGAVLPLQPRTSSDQSSSPAASHWFDKLEPAQREINAALMFLEESVQNTSGPAT